MCLGGGVLVRRSCQHAAAGVLPALVSDMSLVGKSLVSTLSWASTNLCLRCTGGSTCRRMLVGCQWLTVAVALCVPLLPVVRVCVCLQVLCQGLPVRPAALPGLLPVLGAGGGHAAGRSQGHGAPARQLSAAQVGQGGGVGAWVGRWRAFARPSYLGMLAARVAPHTGGRHTA